jgi:hypothetical protein
MDGRYRDRTGWLGWVRREEMAGTECKVLGGQAPEWRMTRKERRNGRDFLRWIALEGRNERDRMGQIGSREMEG